MGRFPMYCVWLAVVVFAAALLWAAGGAAIEGRYSWFVLYGVLGGYCALVAVDCAPFRGKYRLQERDQ